jgi:antitoxin HigA-1
MRKNRPAPAPLERERPEDVMRRMLDRLGIGVPQAADQMGITRAALYGVLNGDYAVSAEMAVRFERLTGWSAEALMHLQVAFDVAEAAWRLDHRGPVKVSPRLVEAGWRHDLSEAQQQVEAQLSEAQQQIEAFANAVAADGTLLHPCFAELQDDMEGLARTDRAAGKTPVIEDLYRRAVAGNPRIRDGLAAMNDRQQIDLSSVAGTRRRASRGRAGAG